jgi:anti-anti-sigma regulatory factor
MADTLALAADCSHSAAILRIVGELRLANARRVETAAMKLLAEAPVGLVLDVAELRLGDEMGLLIIPVIARRAEREHGLRVVLTGVPPPVGVRLHQLGVGFIDRFDTVSLARASLERDSAPRSFAVDLPFDSSAPRQARTVVEYACDSWGHSHVVQDALIIVSELVVNAISHAQPRVQLVVRLRDHLQIEIADGSHDLPALRAPVRHEPGGCGLAMVDSLSASWGARLTDSGKVVWAVLPLFPKLLTGRKPPST